MSENNLSIVSTEDGKVLRTTISMRRPHHLLLALVWPTPPVWPGPPMQMQMLSSSQNQLRLDVDHGDEERRRTSCLPLPATPGQLGPHVVREPTTIPRHHPHPTGYSIRSSERRIGGVRIRSRYRQSNPGNRAISGGNQLTKRQDEQLPNMAARSRHPAFLSLRKFTKIPTFQPARGLLPVEQTSSGRK